MSSTPLPPPSDIALERAVLGATLYSSDLARQVAALSPDLFFVEKHRDFVRILAEIVPALNGGAPDPALLNATALSMGLTMDLVFLAEAMEDAVSIVRIERHVELLHDLAAAREGHAITDILQAAHQRGAAGALDPAVWDAVEERLARARALRGRRNGAGTAAWELYDAAVPWKFPEVASLITGLLPLKGVTWLGGTPKSYKSLFMLYLAMAIGARRGCVAENFPILEHPKILYVAREDGGARVQERPDDILAAWTERPKPGAVRFVFRPPLDLLNRAHVAWIIDTCRREGITVVVLDTWTTLSPSANPLGTMDQAQLAAVVVDLAEQIDGQVIVVDHSRKNRPDGKPLSSADIFGPPQKWAAAEHVIMLARSDDGRRLQVFLESKDMDGARFQLDVAPRGSGREKFTLAGTVAALVPAQRELRDKNRDAIHQRLKTSPEVLSVDQVQQALAEQGDDLAERTIQRHLKALVKAKSVRQTGKGKATRYFALLIQPATPSGGNEGGVDE